MSARLFCVAAFVFVAVCGVCVLPLDVVGAQRSRAHPQPSIPVRSVSCRGLMARQLAVPRAFVFMSDVSFVALRAPDESPGSGCAGPFLRARRRTWCGPCGAVTRSSLGPVRAG